MSQVLIPPSPVETGAAPRPDVGEETAQRVSLLAALVERRLATDWSAGDELGEVCGYAVTAPGKLFRPILLLESAGAVGGEIDRVVPAAAGAEGAHVASLVHDDIIDGDEVRRGLPAAHVAFGRDAAIVGGDALIFYLFDALGECGRRGVPHDRIVSAMTAAARAGADLCRGQMLEEQIRRTYDCRLSTYLDMIEGKTGALFRASCAIGAVLGGGSADQADALARYGTLLGYAFQITDDLLPYLSDTDSTGKPTGSDLANRRLTVPFLLGRADADARTTAELDALMTGEGDLERRWAALTGLLQRIGAVDRARALAAQYADEAIAALQVLPATPSRTTLTYFADAAVQRCR